MVLFKNYIGFVSIAVIVLLFACSSSSAMDGTYTGEEGVSKKWELTFKPNGEVYLSIFGQITQLKYEVDDNHIKIITPQGNQIWTIQDDGALKFGEIKVKKK